MRTKPKSKTASEVEIGHHYFTAGNGYNDFSEGTDKVPEYGLAAVGVGLSMLWAQEKR